MKCCLRSAILKGPYAVSCIPIPVKITIIFTWWDGKGKRQQRVFETFKVVHHLWRNLSLSSYIFLPRFWVLKLAWLIEWVQFLSSLCGTYNFYFIIQRNIYFNTDHTYYVILITYFYVSFSHILLLNLICKLYVSGKRIIKRLWFQKTGECTINAQVNSS